MALPIYPRNRLRHVLLVEPEEVIWTSASGGLIEIIPVGRWLLAEVQAQCPGGRADCRAHDTWAWRFVHAPRREAGRNDATR